MPGFFGSNIGPGHFVEWDMVDFEYWCSYCMLVGRVFASDWHIVPCVLSRGCSHSFLGDVI